MASLLVALLLATAEPVAPVPPAMPEVKGPVAPALHSSTTPADGPPLPHQRERDGVRAGPPSPNPPQPRPMRTDDLIVPPRNPLAEPVTTPPNLTGAALRDELRASAQRRQEELAALARERARLEKLAADVAAARAGLREETARLDVLARKAAAEKAAAAAAPAAPPRKPTPDDEKRAQAMARTLKGMKADQAATLLARLDRPLAVSLLRRMRPGDAGAVLEKMKPDAAADLFSLMASPEAAGGAR